MSIRLIVQLVFSSHLGCTIFSIKDVDAARPLIAEVIDQIHCLFPRGEGTLEWNLPKTHGLTKMQHYMQLFGSAMNFYGSTGEANHKVFVKDPGTNTQKRIGSFVTQSAERSYERAIAVGAMGIIEKQERKKCRKLNPKQKPHFRAEGKYTVDVADNGTVKIGRQETKQRFVYIDAPEGLAETVIKFVRENGWKGGFDLTAYTCCKFQLDGRGETFRSATKYLDKEWVDWCLVKFEDSTGIDKTYPCQILGMVRFEDEAQAGGNKGLHFVVRSCEEPLAMEELEDEFVTKVKLGCGAYNYSVVPVESVAYPLLVFKNYGGHALEHFVALPKRKWHEYFAERIND